jgi:ribosomal protein L40E
MPVTTCTCGLPMQLRLKALICVHCDGTAPHVAASCGRCQRLNARPAAA